MDSFEGRPYYILEDGKTALRYKAEKLGDFRTPGIRLEDGRSRVEDPEIGKRLFVDPYANPRMEQIEGVWHFDGVSLEMEVMDILASQVMDEIIEEEKAEAAARGA